MHMVKSTSETNCDKIKDIFLDPSQFNLLKVLELVRLLVKAKSSAIPLIGNDTGHSWKFEPFKAYPCDMHMHIP